MDYKNKYLKYKNKYLSLRDKYLNIFSEEHKTKGYNKNKLIGGANCPILGYYQHKGECWHDSLSMVLLYSDGLSGHIQNVFENDFNIDECIESAKQNPPFLIPKNIEDKDYDEFIQLSKIYISELQSRYINEKLPIKTLLDKSPIKTLFRRNSKSETLSCTYTIYEIMNINIYPKYFKTWKLDSHGGNLFNDVIIISLFNYFLLNYFPNKVEKQLKFINMKTIDLYNPKEFDPNFLVYKLDDLKLDSYIKSLLVNISLLDDKLNNCIGIVLNIYHKYKIDKTFGEIKEDPNISGHIMSFIKCNDKLFFYDNNGVIEDDPNYESDEDHDDDPQVYQSYSYKLRKSGRKLLVEFDWIKYLRDRIAFAKPMLESLMSMDRIHKLELLKIILLSFSEFIYIKKTKEKISYGRDYLKDYFIYLFEIVLKSEKLFKL